MKLGYYKQYDGKIYNVISIVKNGQTLEDMAICYETKEYNQHLAYPISVFKEKIKLNNNVYIYRFKKMEHLEILVPWIMKH